MNSLGCLKCKMSVVKTNKKIGISAVPYQGFSYDLND
jgi:hypothetical protein